MADIPSNEKQEVGLQSECSVSSSMSRHKALTRITAFVMVFAFAASCSNQDHDRRVQSGAAFAILFDPMMVTLKTEERFTKEVARLGPDQSADVESALSLLESGAGRTRTTDVTPIIPSIGTLALFRGGRSECFTVTTLADGNTVLVKSGHIIDARFVTLKREEPFMVLTEPQLSRFGLECVKRFYQPGWATYAGLLHLRHFPRERNIYD